jgi:hypothetical protein
MVRGELKAAWEWSDDPTKPSEPAKRTAEAGEELKAQPGDVGGANGDSHEFQQEEKTRGVSAPATGTRKDT